MFVQLVSFSSAPTSKLLRYRLERQHHLPLGQQIDRHLQLQQLGDDVAHVQAVVKHAAVRREGNQSHVVSEAQPLAQISDGVGTEALDPLGLGAVSEMNVGDNAQVYEQLIASCEALLVEGQLLIQLGAVQNQPEVVNVYSDGRRYYEDRSAGISSSRGGVIFFSFSFGCARTPTFLTAGRSRLYLSPLF